MKDEKPNFQSDSKIKLEVNQNFANISPRNPHPPPPSAAVPSHESLLRRRFANDPSMMHELQRYQRLMLLTIFPNIPTESSEPSTGAHPHAHIHTAKVITPTPLINDNKQTTTKIFDPSSSTKFPFPSHFLPPAQATADYDFDLDEHESEMVSKNLKEGMNSLNHLKIDLNTGDQLSKSVGSLETDKKASDDHSSRKSIKSATSETRLPTPGKGLVIPENPKHGSRKHRRQSMIQAHCIEGLAMNGGQVESDTSELDLLTLAELYFESRHKVFGEEWNQRQNSVLRSGQPNGILGGKVAGTGVNQRPHRLVPLPKEALQAPVLAPNLNIKNMGVPAPGGLHLSVNYTKNLDLEETLVLIDRARALKPRFRRLNSMSDITVGSEDLLIDMDSNLHRPTSAPDLNKKPANDHNSHEDDEDYRHATPETPARANTPTSAPRSSGKTKPPLVGQSLVTSLARISSSRPNTRDSTRDGSSSPDHRNTSKITSLFPDNPPPSLASSFRQRSDVKHMADLDVLKELQASLYNQLAKSKIPIDVKSRKVTMKGSNNLLPKSQTLKSAKTVISPIESSLESSSNNLKSSESRNQNKLEAIGGNRPLHHSLPARLTTPETAGLKNNSRQRKQSRVLLTPLDPSRKISAP